MNIEDEQCRFCEQYTGTSSECGMCSKKQEEVSARYRCEEYKYRMFYEMTNDGAELLVDAIVKRAVKDLRLSPEGRTYDSRQSLYFFRSDYFKSLCSIDGEKIIQHIRSYKANKVKKTIKSPKVCRNRSVEYNDERMKLKDWSVKLGISYSTLIWRLNNGWSIEDAFTKGVWGK